LPKLARIIAPPAHHAASQWLACFCATVILMTISTIWRSYNGPTQLLGWICTDGLPDNVCRRGFHHVDRPAVTIIQWIYADQIEAYLSQGWSVSKLLAHHGARKSGRNFMAVMEL
jgi:hypothetical protein